MLNKRTKKKKQKNTVNNPLYIISYRKKYNIIPNNGNFSGSIEYLILISRKIRVRKIQDKEKKALLLLLFFFSRCTRLKFENTILIENTNLMLYKFFFFKF